MINNVIYTDIDGVVLNWLRGFYWWVYKTQGYTVKHHQVSFDIHGALGINKVMGHDFIKEFNRSIEATQLLPNLDSVKYIKKLYEEGYSFVGVTSFFSGHMPILNNRFDNIKRYFGEAFVDVLVVDHEKKSVLEDLYDHEIAIREKSATTPIYWIEDHTKNCRIGKDIGFESILMSTSYNTDADSDDYDMQVNNWEDIYNVIING